MISPDTVKQLTQSADPHCLTLYLNTGPDQPRTTYASRFCNLCKSLNSRVPAPDRKPFEGAAARVAGFLDQYQPAGNSCLVYAAEKTWQQFSSRVPVRDEVSWGRPDTNQLLWLLEEYRPYGVLIADKQHVRFLAVRLNEFECYQEFSTEVDTTDWRKQVIGSSGRGGAVQKGGVDARAFDNRYMEQVRHFWRSLHKPVTELVERYHVKRMVLAANKSLLPEFARSLPPSLAAAVVIKTTMDGFASPAAAVKRVFPEIEAWEEERDRKLVSELLNAAGIGAKAAVGIDPVLKHLQDGRVSRLVVARGLTREVIDCGACGYVTTAATNCPACGSDQVQKTSLAAALARLVRRFGVPLEVVKRGPADELAKNSGLGAFLRF